MHAHSLHTARLWAPFFVPDVKLGSGAAGRPWPREDEGGRAASFRVVQMGKLLAGGVCAAAELP